MLSVALTGGIGCGKSTVCGLFAEKGVVIIDTDLIARQLVEPDEPALSEIRDAFGESMIKPDGTLDRATLAALVFSDPEKRKQLEAILHPRIRHVVRQQLASLNDAYCIVAIPLLFETEQQQSYDRVLVVDCDEQQQLNRTQARDSRSPAEIQAIIKSQVSRAYRLQHADDIIDNNSDTEHLRQQVEKLHLKYTNLARHNS